MSEHPSSLSAAPGAASDSGADASQARRDLLGPGARRRWWQRASLWLGVAVMVSGVAGYAWWSQSRKAQAAPQYVSQEVRRGDITLTVMANGTLQPTRSVTIGSELSGTVSKVFVDVNDRVRKGQVLVELDTTKLRSQLDRSRASLVSAQARLAEALATVTEARANLQRLEEVHRISGGKVPSASELDTGRATLARAQAAQKSMEASVQDAKAAVATDETNLAKASIVSPISGVVLTRSVEPGNAVAASLQAVTLFTLAEDLGQLRLDVNVDEADVGSVQEGQKAGFTVSAYPGRSYPARVARVAFGSTTTDNVVTYTTRLNVDNADQSLRPGMTASATIVSTERRDVLLVPNAALRFVPAQTLPAAAGGGGERGGPAPNRGGGAGIMGQLMPRPPNMGGPRRGGGADAPLLPKGERQIWLEQQGRAVPMTVRTGITDGRVTEVMGEQLQPGMRVITDQRSGGAQ